MKSITSRATFVAFAFLNGVIAQQPTDKPDSGLTGLKTPTYVGCFSSSGSLTDMGDYTFQAMGWCQPLCVRQAKAILAFTGGTNCLCGDSLPPGSAKIDDSHCQTECQGYPQQKCGGDNAYAVYQDGYKPGDPTGTIRITPPSSTMSAPTTTPTDNTNTADGVSTQVKASTVFITQSGTTVPSVISITPSSPPENNNPGPNKAAIAAGVVVAIIGVAAIVGGVILFMRRKRKQALEDERRRHEDQTRLATGDKPPSTFSLADSRLEPGVMFQRRQSDGSIMDNQDYTRRILQVRNPDDH